MWGERSVAELAEVAVDVFSFITSEESLVVVKCKLTEQLLK